MSKKFFSLIHGDVIHPAPKKKIIPQAEFSILQEGMEILKRIKKEAELYRIEVAKECEQLKENAFRAGYEEGLQQWSTHLVDFEKQMEKFQKETLQLIIPVALKAAKKIVGREIELSKETIVDIVASNLKAAGQHKKITIYVNKKDLAVLEKNKPRLRDLFEHLESFSIHPREDIKPGGCVIETEVGIINAQMDHRWHVLERAFARLST